MDQPKDVAADDAVILEKMLLPIFDKARERRAEGATKYGAFTNIEKGLDHSLEWLEQELLDQINYAAMCLVNVKRMREFIQSLQSLTEDVSYISKAIGGRP